MKKLTISSLLLLIPLATNASGIYPEYVALVEKHAALQNLDKNLVWAVMYAESRGKRTAISPKNARGLMQVIPPTAARMGVNPKHLFDPEQNIIAGTRYLRFLTNRFRGNLDHIIAGYNAGEGAVEKYQGIPPYRETQNYVKTVKARYSRLSSNPIQVARNQSAQQVQKEPTAKAIQLDTSNVFGSNQPAMNNQNLSVMVF